MCRRCQPDHHPLQAPACREPSLLPLHFPNSALATHSPSDLQVSPPKPLPGKPCSCITLISFSIFTGFIWELGDCGSCTTS